MEGERRDVEAQIADIDATIAAIQGQQTLLRARLEGINAAIAAAGPPNKRRSKKRVLVDASTTQQDEFTVSLVLPQSQPH